MTTTAMTTTNTAMLGWTVLVLGLALFIGVHSVRVVAEGWRGRMLARLGEGGWKGLYSVASLAGLMALGWGWGRAKLDPIVLWSPPYFTRHLAALLVLVAFVLIVAAYVPRNSIKARLHHPMILSVKLWALAHLLANGTLAHVVLFGAFLVWSVLAFRAARARDRVAGTVYAPGTPAMTALTVAIGVAGWAFFAFWAHLHWIGVSPLGR